MFTIRFTTEAYAPDETIVLRASGPTDWIIDIPGDYEDGGWLFRLNEGDYPAGIAFKFLLKPGRWMLGADLTLSAEELAGTHTWQEGEIAFPMVSQVVTERGAVAERFLVRDLRPDYVHDVIIVGSGAGGGMLASRLADKGRDVLVLEAGSYLFPTHVANLPRRLKIGQFDKHIWGLWPDFKVINYVNVDGSFFGGGQGFNLGGRSIFWGGLIPRMAAWELEPWPTAVRDYLLNGGYDAAEAAMDKTAPIESAYQDKARGLIDQTLPAEYSVEDAPVAVQYRGYTNLSLAGGMWSSADLLLEDRLVDSGGAPGWKRKAPTINLNHAAWNVIVENARPGRVVGVRAYDLLAEAVRSYSARIVVLAAGTLESAKIALQSGLRDPAGLIGHGLTDHHIRYVPFTLPPDSPYASPQGSPFQSARMIARHAQATEQEHPFMLGIELGADFNQGRYVDPDNLAREIAQRGDWTLCELVCQYNAPLVETNSLTVSARSVDAGGAADPVIVDVQRALPSAQALSEVDTLAHDLLDALGAQPVIGATNGLGLNDAVLGGVAHEVGTLRMTDSAAGVVDPDLRFLDYDNLYACDNSTFPSSPAANPTLTLVALALRLADHIDDVLGPA